MTHGWNRFSDQHSQKQTTPRHGYRRWQLAGTLTLATVVMASSVVSPARAQVTPDATLGTENSVVVPNLTIRGVPSDRIDGGAIRGGNLFHSFLQFNVDAGQGVYFSNPDGITNILSRVTGSDPSRIMGRLGVLGAANLFLLNPNGILFGPNASLDVQGSFVASTANAIQLGDSGQFSATDPANSTLLAVQPGALFLNALNNQSAPTGGIAPGQIINQANLVAGQDLTLAAHDLAVQGLLQAGRDLTLQASNLVQIRDSPTQPFIAQSGRDLQVQGNQRVDIFALNHPESGLFAGRDLILRSPTPVIGDAHYWAGGNFRVERLDGSPGSLISPNDPIIRTSGDVTLNDYTGTSLHIFAGGSVTILGNITITGPDVVNGLPVNVTLSDGTPIVVDGATTPVLDIRAGTTDFLPTGLTPTPFPGPGNTTTGGFLSFPASSADITLGTITNLSGAATGSGQILLTNQHSPNPALTGSIQTGAIITYGDVAIDSSLDIQTNGTIDTTIVNQNAGSITLLAGRDITANGILNSSVTGGQGVAGDITVQAVGNIQTQNVQAASLNNGGGFATVRLESSNGTVTFDGDRITASNVGTGFAGDIFISADGNIQSSNNTIIESVGRFGRVFIDSVNGSVQLNQSQVTTTNNGAERAGNISITAGNGSVDLNQTQVFTSNTGTGVAGDIRIDAATDINILNSSTVESRGAFGQIFLGSQSTVNNIQIDRSFLVATNDASGTGGLIDITSSTLDINSSALRVASSGTANGGRVDLTTLNGDITLRGSSLIDASISGTGTAGNGVTIDAGSGTLQLNENSQITTATTGTAATAAAGAIAITADLVSLNDTSSINATTAGAATGGNIAIAATTRVELDNSSLINAAVQSGSTADGGDITITTGDFSLQQGSRVQTRTFGSGAAGDIQLDFTNTATIAGVDPASLLYSGMSSDTSSTGAGGSITINDATNPVGTLTLADGAFLSARATDFGSGGNVTINVNNLAILNGGQVLTSSSGSGDAGDITVNATGNVTIAGSRAPLNPPSSPFGTLVIPISLDGLTFDTTANPNVEQSGTGGIPFVSLQRDGAGAIAATDATGTAPIGTGSTVDYYDFTITRDGSRGIFDIDNAASNPVSGVDTELFLYDALTGQLLAQNDDFYPANNGSTNVFDSRIAYNFNSAGTYVLAVGRFNTNAANGTLVTGTPLAPTDPYLLQLSLQNQGIGTFNISDRNPNQGLNSGLFAQSQAAGSGGDITVQGANVAITNNAVLNATTIGIAPGGNISVTATNTGTTPMTTPILTIDNGSISAAVVSPTKTTTVGTGDGGSVTLTANNGAITMNNLASVSASTDSAGNSGTVILQTTGGAPISLLNGARVEARTQGTGAAGAIQVTAPDITISGFGTVGGEPLYSGLYVSSENENSAEGGSIAINATTNPGRTLVVSNGAVLSALNQSSAPGGNITVDVADVQLLNGGQLVTAAEGTGPAGNITINATNVTIAGTNPNFIDRQNVATGSGSLADAEQNDTRTTAQSLNNTFALTPNGNIALSTVIPHVAIAGVGDGTYDYYSFNVTAGNRVIVDIDGDTNNDNAADAGAFDTELFLFNAATGELLAESDDANPAAGGSGSSSSLAVGGRWDSFIEYTFTDPGTYVIGVGRFNADAIGGSITGNSPQLGDAYTLHVSLDQRNTRNANQGANSGLFAQSSAINGNAGTLTINAPQVTLQDNARISAATVAGTSGSILLPNLNTLQVQNSLISAETQSGIAGSVIVNAAQSVQLGGTLADGTPAGLLAAATLGGTAGSVQITTPQLTVSNGARAAVSSTGGAGTAGNLDVIASNVLLNNNARLEAETDQGTGGNIRLQGLQSLTVQNSLISAETQSGTAGSVLVNAAQSVQLSGTLSDGTPGGLLAAATLGGTAGSVQITTPQLTVTDGARAAVSSTGGAGTAGNLDVVASDVLLSNNASLEAETDQGSGGNIRLQNLQLLTVQNSLISASTRGGTAGSVSVNAAQAIQLSGGGGLRAEATAGGNAGNMQLVTSQLTIADGAGVAVSSQQGAGTAGNLDVLANGVVLNNNAFIRAETDQGSGGNIRLPNLQFLQVWNNSQISASTVGGQGGSLTVNAAQFVDLAGGGGLLAQATGSGRGTAGTLTLTTGELTVRDRAQISTSTSGQGDAGRIGITATNFSLNSGGRVASLSTSTGNAGSISIDVRDRLRTHAGTISAASERGGGGLITISARDIRLTGSSLISSSVFNGAGGGGSIFFNSDVFIALEDSDILANAEFGEGGAIRIDSPAFVADIFANVGRNPGRNFNRFRGNGRVDISASSQFGVSGIVAVPDFSFLQNSLSSLASNFVSADQIVAGSCIARRNVEQGSFTVTGVGGLPRTPYDTIAGRYGVAGLRSLNGEPVTTIPTNSNGLVGTAPSPTPTTAKIPTWQPGNPIQEAQGMMVLPDGRLVLGTLPQLAAIAQADDLICHPVTAPTTSGQGPS